MQVKQTSYNAQGGLLLLALIIYVTAVMYWFLPFVMAQCMYMYGI